MVAGVAGARIVDGLPGKNLDIAETCGADEAG